MSQNWAQHKPEQFEFVGGWVRNCFSNMAISPITIDGITYQSVENYFQAQKSLNRNDHLRISTLPPNKSKQEGRKLKLRADWEKVKVSVMKKGLLAKFSQVEWKKQLLSTDDTPIIEWNNWNDKIWGVSIKDCEGQNLLGVCLMEIRDYFKS